MPETFFNSTEKMFLPILIKTVQIPGAPVYDTHMEMHTSTVNKYISLAREFHKKRLNPSHKTGVMYQGNYRKQVSHK